MIKAQKYQEECLEEWEEFVETKARNSTFLHTRKFFQHNARNQELDFSQMFFKNGNIICVLPAVLQLEEGRRIFNSHAYSTYGGFVVSEEVGIKDAIEIVDLRVEIAKSENVDEIIVRNPFRIFNHIPSDETDYAMWLKGFHLLRRDVEIVLPLKNFTVENVENLYDNSTSRSIRKAGKEGVEIRVTRDFSKYWTILTENLSQRYEAKPTHTIEQFQILERLVGSEKIKLFGAYYGDELIAGIVIFVTNKLAIHAQYIAGLSSYQNLRPLNLLIHKISVWAIENNFQFFNLGMSTNPDGSGINLGLSRFKEGFGGRSVLRETMHLKINE